MAQLLVHASKAHPAGHSVSPSHPFHTSEALRKPLQAMVGAAGSQILLSRAVALAKAECPRLAAVSVDEKGSLEGLAEMDPPLTPEEADECEILLVGNTVELLCTFLGEAMALHFIQAHWPDASFVDVEPAKGGTA